MGRKRIPRVDVMSTYMGTTADSGHSSAFEVWHSISAGIRKGDCIIIWRKHCIEGI
jgi:hypothetical protein